MGRAADQLPVIVLTGFLGSGKTTLLNRLLRHPELADTAVIVNELGDIGLDHHLVAGGDDNIVLLNAGCLCCGMLNSFKETLADLYHRRVRGEVPAFARVLVETTGLADPAPVLQTLLRDSFLVHYYRLGGVVVTVDACFAERQLDEHIESAKQIAVADRLIVTKTDIAEGRLPPSLRTRLRALNPTALIRTACFGDVAPDDILHIEANGANESIQAGEGASPDNRGTVAAVPHDHTHKIRADSFIVADAVTWAGLAGWMELVRELLGDKMIRCKGVLHIAEIDKPVLIQGVQTVFAAPEPLDAWPGGDKRSRLVCITRELDPSTLRASLKLLHAEPGTYRPATLDELLANER